MNEKQRRLVEYLNGLHEPAPPPVPAEIEESIAPGAAPPARAPPRISPESVRRMLEKAPADPHSAGGDIEESLPASGPELALHPTPDELVERAVTATEKALDDRELTADEQDILEAIVIPGKRPVLDVVNGDFGSPPPGWEFLDTYRAGIKAVLPSVGRIDVPELLTIPYAGTGFFVGEGVLMTNRHVARLFVQGVGAGARYLTFQAELNAAFDPLYEVGGPGPGAERYVVVEPLMVHPHWDMALLKVKPADAGKVLPPPLPLARHAPDGFEGGGIQNIFVAGYPMLDTRRNDPVEIEQQMTIFRKIFGRKRIMPGYMTGYRDVRTKWDALLHATVHDASTLGGNSGSAVAELASGVVLSLHFGGRYLEANFGVPTWELARDPQIDALGLNFVDPAGAAAAETPPPAWLGAWGAVQPLAAAGAPGAR